MILAWLRHCCKSALHYMQAHQRQIGSLLAIWVTRRLVIEVASAAA